MSYTDNGEQITAAIASNDIIEAIAELDGLVNDEILGVKINPLGIYCQKTGAQIGERNQNSLYSLHKICGKEAIVSNLYNCTSMNVHPAWLITGKTNSSGTNEILDALMESDPVGYAVYCFGFITQRFYQTQKNTDKRREPFSERYWAMARAHALMSARGIGNIDELNFELCKILTYAPDATHLLHTKIRAFGHTPDNLAQLAVSGELADKLHECVNKIIASIGYASEYVKATQYVDVALSAEDAARGPSQFRRQRKSKRDVKESQLFAELSKLFGKADIGVTKHNSADFSLFEKAQAKREQDMEAQLRELGNFDLDLIDEDEDDNEVEVRVLARPFEPNGESEPPQIEQQEQQEQIVPTIKTISHAMNEDLPSISDAMAAIAQEVNKTLVLAPVAPEQPKKLSVAEKLALLKKGGK